MSQEQVASLINVSKDTYRNYEKARTEPELDTIKKLASVFNVSIDFLFGDEIIENEKEQIKNDIKRILKDLESLIEKL